MYPSDRWVVLNLTEHTDFILRIGVSSSVWDTVVVLSCPDRGGSLQIGHSVNLIVETICCLVFISGHTLCVLTLEDCCPEEMWAPGASENVILRVLHVPLQVMGFSIPQLSPQASDGGEVLPLLDYHLLRDWGCSSVGYWACYPPVL